MTTFLGIHRNIYPTHDTNAFEHQIMNDLHRDKSVKHEKTNKLLHIKHVAIAILCKSVN